MSSIKILYDHQIFSYQRYGGISRYHSVLIQKLSQHHEIAPILGMIDSNNVYLQENDAVSLFKVFSNLKMRKNVFLYGLNALVSRKDLAFTKYDIFHPTYYNPYFLTYVRKCPLVVTVHDMTHEIYPEYNAGQNREILWKKKILPKANKIIAVSENTKKDLLHFYDLDPENIDVIYHGNSLKDIDIIKPRYNLPLKYILYVGRRDRHKNFMRFLDAMSEICKQVPDLHIVCVGGPAFSRSETAYISQKNLRKKIHLVHLSDSELGYAYKNATLFIYPSLYEGFGIPIIEAFNMGCPVALSNTSCFPEIAGDAGIFFDPYDRVSIKDTIELALRDENLRKILVNKGFDRAKKFKWDFCAKETIVTYESVIKQ